MTIVIRDGRIYFYHAYKTTVQARDFQCISAYVCQHCKNVLLAYFVGHMNKESLPDFAEKDSMKYAYEMGGCDGGKWIAIQEHQHKSACRWQYSTARGISNGVDFYLKQLHYTERKPLELELTQKQALIDAIEKGMEGFTIVSDEIGTDAPILMFNKALVL